MRILKQTFSLVLLGCNEHTTLYKFKVYSRMT